MKLPPPVKGARWIPLTKGKFVLVDADLYEELNKINWHYGPRGGYAVAGNELGGSGLKMHRLIMKAEPDEIVDHINFDGLDCRRANMRVTTWQESNAHRRKHVGKNRRIASKFKGVCRPADYNKFVALITYNNKTRRIGVFETEEEAARAYDREACKHFGKYAELNFPRQRSK